MLTSGAKMIWELHFEKDMATDFAGIPINKKAYDEDQTKNGWKILDFGDIHKSIAKGKFILPVSFQTFEAAKGKPVFVVAGKIYRVKKSLTKKGQYEIVQDKKEISNNYESRPEIEIKYDQLFGKNKPILDRLFGFIEVEDETLFRQALTSPNFSSLFNQQKAKDSLPIEHNIALATLGDGIIKYILTDWLYKKRESIKSISAERQKYESNENLSRIGKSLNFNPISEGTITDRMMATLIEALVAVAFLKFGIEYTGFFIQKQIIQNTYDYLYSNVL